MVKEVQNETFVELSPLLKHFNSGSLKPIAVFNSNVEVIFATVVPGTTNMAIVYCDAEVYKLHLLNGKL